MPKRSTPEKSDKPASSAWGISRRFFLSQMGATGAAVTAGAHPSARAIGSSTLSSASSTARPTRP